MKYIPLVDPIVEVCVSDQEADFSFLMISHFKFFIWPLLQRATLNFPSIRLAKSLKVGKGGLPPPSSPGAIRLSELFRLATEQYHQTMTNKKFENEKWKIFSDLP
jgi:hypothetical protein